jgi:hypothetical protein
MRSTASKSEIEGTKRLEAYEREKLCAVAWGHRHRVLIDYPLLNSTSRIVQLEVRCSALGKHQTLSVVPSCSIYGTAQKYLIQSSPDPERYLCRTLFSSFEISHNDLVFFFYFCALTDQDRPKYLFNQKFFVRSLPLKVLMDLLQSTGNNRRQNTARIFFSGNLVLHATISM